MQAVAQIVEAIAADALDAGVGVEALGDAVVEILDEDVEALAIGIAIEGVDAGGLVGLFDNRIGRQWLGHVLHSSFPDD